MKTLDLQLHDFVDVQKFQEKLHISFAASLNQVLIDIFNYYESEGVDTVSIEINSAILQKSYQNNSIMLAKAIKNRIKFPFVRSSKSGMMVTLKASIQNFELVFLRQLREKLDQRSLVIFALDDLPPAHQEQPAVLTFRLRKEGYTNLKFMYVGSKIYFTWKPKQKIEIDTNDTDQTTISTISESTSA